jgi:hypothetical protein
MNKNESIDLIKEVIDEMNDMLPDEKHIDIESNDFLKKIESLQLVNLIVGLEERIEERFDEQIVFSLDDQDNENSFLESIEALSEYILKNV